VQTPPLGPVKPVLQVQLASALQTLHEAPELAGHARQVVATVAATVVENLPAPQLVQAVATVAAVVIEYFPASQLVHVAVPAVVL
jgi:hypothetical protein